MANESRHERDVCEKSDLSRSLYFHVVSFVFSSAVCTITSTTQVVELWPDPGPATPAPPPRRLLPAFDIATQHSGLLASLLG